MNRFMDSNDKSRRGMAFKKFIDECVYCECLFLLWTFAMRNGKFNFYAGELIECQSDENMFSIRHSVR